MLRPVQVRLGEGIEQSEWSPGRLFLARNCHYEGDSRQLSKVKGRSNFGAISGASLRGLVVVTFRDGTKRMIVSTGSAYYTADPTKAADSFASRTSGLSGQGSMAGVYMESTDRAYFSDGVNRMQVWTGSGSMRNAGLDRPSAGTLTFLSNTATEYLNVSTFQYFHTEYDSANEIESPASDPQQLAATAEKGTFKYSFPTKANSSADKYRVYRTPHGGNVFYLIAEIASTNARYYDGDDSEALGSSVDNDTVWGFKTVDDIFLQSQDTYAMTGNPILGNYITENGIIPRGDIVGELNGSQYVAGVSGFPEDLYYSLPARPETFSPAAWVRFGDGRGGPITAAGKANDWLIVFKPNSIFRLNKFPDIGDEGLGTGGAKKEEITSDSGAVAKRAVCNFGLGQPNSRLFYVSPSGPAMTDAYQTWPLTPGLDWSPRMLNFGAMDKAVARNYSKYAQVHLWVPSKNSSEPDLKYIYHYHPRHLSMEAGYPVGHWTGPVHERCAAADVLYGQTHEPRMFVADTNTSGKVYLIDEGVTDAQNYDDADGKIDWEWETWPDHHGAESVDKKVSRVFLGVVGPESFAPRLEVAVNKREDWNQVAFDRVGTDQSATTRVMGTSTVSPVRARTYRGSPVLSAASFAWRMQEKAAADRAVSRLELEMEGGGPQR
jgi:hypothetical protein